ncbi:MAG: ATP-binding cassette, subfamily bacterial [Actinomycetota bacterium]
MMRGIPPAKNEDDLPSMPAALLHSLKFAYKAQPGLLLLSFGLTIGGLVPEALSALWLRLLLHGITGHNDSLTLRAAIGLALTGGTGWLLRTVGSRFTAIFGDRIALAVETHVAHLQASVSTIEHHERPDYLNRLQILHDHSFLLNHVYPSLMQYIGSATRLVITVALLMSINPVLGLLVLFAIPTVTVSSRRAGVERRAEEHAAPNVRLARHFFELATTPGAAKEIRVSSAESVIAARRRDAFIGGYTPVAHERWVTAFQNAAAWFLFSAAYVASVTYVANRSNTDAGDVVLTLAAGAALSRYLGMTVGQTEFLRWNIEAAQRLLWLERYVASKAGSPDDTEAPMRVEQGITFDHVSFKYPGTDVVVLDDVNLTLPAGSVVAVVGENGAGKSTLTKLLCRLYDPTEGRITVDGVDLATIDPVSWNERLGGAFQDFFRFEFLAANSVGLGELARLDDRPAVAAAVDRGGAVDVIEKLPDGLETQLGPSWHNGRDLSFGQWQKLAVARGFMRDRPLLCVLDEPTAALDAETEHQLFERFADASRAAANDGRITVLVSHRFSTVRMAVLIVVLDGSRVAEFGDHETLMAKRGLYAELYGIQAAGYR